LDAACMLLGGVSFVMVLFVLVNTTDPERRRYAWKVVSNTISVFMAVLFFSGNNQVVEDFFGQFGLSEGTMVVVHFMHCFIYIAIMMLTIGYITGVLGPNKSIDFSSEVWVYADAMLVCFEEEVVGVELTNIRAEKRKDTKAKMSTTVDEKWGLEVSVIKKKKFKEVAERRNKAWSILLAHMGGFAAIDACGEMQQHSMFRTSPLTAFVPVIITTGIMSLVFAGTLFIRKTIKPIKQSHQARETATEAVLEDARYARSLHERAEMVHEIVTEAENDILSLMVSFTTIQVVRFLITGRLPGEEGEEEGEHFSSNILNKRHVFILWFIGVLSLGVAMLLARWLAYGRRKLRRPRVAASTATRVTATMPTRRTRSTRRKRRRSPWSPAPRKF